MEIRKLMVENFKCHKKLNIDFSKITLITGANSSGKSSILHPILSIMQSNNFPSSLELNGDYIRLGDYSNIIYMHNKSLPLRICMTLTHEGKETVQDVHWEFNPIDHMPILKSFVASSEFGILRIKRNKNYIVDLKINKPHITIDSSKEDNQKFKNFIVSLKDFMGTPSHIEAPMPISTDKKVIHYKFIDKEFSNVLLKLNLVNLVSFDYQRSISNLADSAHVLRNHFNYIGSFRQNPERQYFLNNNKELKIGTRGENCTDQIRVWSSTKDKMFKDLITSIQSIGLANDISVQNIAGGKFEITIKSGINGTANSIVDVGFGISQFLPILVADKQLGVNSTLFLSQPEIHLHPDLQSNFGDYLQSKVNGSNKRYVIETHSEYLINKLRYHVVKGTLKSEDIKTYFFNMNDGDEAKCTEIKFLASGEIQNAPDEFFKTYMMDSLSIALEAGEQNA